MTIRKQSDASGCYSKLNKYEKMAIYGITATRTVDIMR